MSKTSENYIKLQSEKLGKLKESSVMKQKTLIKLKENEEKTYNEYLSKFVSSLTKKQEVLKSKKNNQINHLKDFR